MTIKNENKIIVSIKQFVIEFFEIYFFLLRTTGSTRRDVLYG